MPANESSRVITAIGTAFVAMIIVLGGLEIYTDYHRTVRDAFERLDNLARIADESISGRLRTIDVLLQDVGREAQAVENTADSEALLAYMKARTQSVPGIRSMSISDPTGLIIYSTLPELQGFDGATRPYYTEPFTHQDKTGLFINGPILASTGKVVIFASRPNAPKKGRWDGVSIITLLPEYFAATLDTTKPPGDGFASLVGMDGTIIARSPKHDFFTGKSVAKGKAHIAHVSSGERVTRATVTVSTDNQRRMVVNRTTDFSELVVAVGWSEEEALSGWRRTAVIKGTVLSALAILTAVLLLRFRRHDRQLVSNQRFITAIADAMPGMVAYWDKDLRCRFANRPYQDWFGKAPEAIIGNTILDLVGERLYALNEPHIRGVLAGKRQQFERTLTKANGDVGHTWAHYIPDQDTTGTVQGFFVLVTDITPLKLAEMRALGLSERLSLATRAGGIGVWEYDLGTGNLVWDDRMRQLYEVAADMTDTTYRTWRSSVHPADLPAAEDLLNRAIRGEAEFDTEFRILVPSGDVRHVHAAALVSHDDTGAATKVIGINWDITEIRRKEKQLAAATAEAERANRAKSEFLANMSHEIRTPLNAILGLAYLMEREGLPPRQQDLAAKIKISGQSLLSIINDILDFSRIEAGKLELDPAPFLLSDLLDAVATIMTVNIGDKGLRLTIRMAPEVPVALSGDSLRLQQVLINLVGNAVKFTAAGEVALGIELDGHRDGKPVLRFTVVDTGIGIPRDKLDGLFQAFSQADSSTTRRFGGSGLGLAISKRLVELMGGSIGAASEPGRGSTFWFTIPLAEASGQDCMESRKPMAVPGQGTRLTGLRVLVVEDNGINQDVARRILELEGARVTLVADGREAVEILSRSPDDFDLVLMDIQMPVMDGYEATTRIRQDLGLTRLPILALTAGAMATEREHAQAVGMNDFITKPFDVEKMVAAILRHAAPPAAPSALPTPAPRPTPAPCPTPAAPSPPAPDAAGFPVIAGIEMRQAILRLGGDAALFRSLLSRVAEQFGGELGRIRAALEAGDSTDAARRLHTLRGAVGNIAATEVAERASTAEALIRDGRTDSIPDGLDALDSALSPLLAAIAAALAAAPAIPAAATPPARPSREAIVGLIAALDERNMAAMDMFEPLRHGLDPAVAATVQTALDGLRFKDAAEMLRSWLRQED